VSDDPPATKRVKREAALVCYDPARRAAADGAQCDEQTTLARVGDLIRLKAQILECIKPGLPGVTEVRFTAKLADEVRRHPGRGVGRVTDHDLGVLRRMGELEVPSVHDLVRAPHPVRDQPLTRSGATRQAEHERRREAYKRRKAGPQPLIELPTPSRGCRETDGPS